MRIRLLLVLAVAVLGVLLVALGTLAYLRPGIGWSASLVLRVVLVSAVALAAASLAAARFVRRRLLSPLAEIARETRAIARGEMDRRAPETGPRELVEVASGVNRMADRLIEERELLAENVQSLEETNRMLVEARDELVRKEKLASIGRLASGLAHEIGNPLNAILSYAEVGRRRGRQGEWLEGVEHEARRIDRIVSGLLDYARPRAAGTEPLDVNALVRDTLELLEAQGRLKGIEVRVRLDDGLPDPTGSPDQLKQVLINLLLNACDAVGGMGDESQEELIEVTTTAESYRGPDGQQARPRRDDDPEEVDYSHLRRLQRSGERELDHRLERGQRVVVIEVQDSGPGLREADAGATIFDPFFTTKEPGRGTGLGLTVSASFVSAMGGVIEASNREDATGARFRVILPAGGVAAGGEESGQNAGGTGMKGGDGR